MSDDFYGEAARLIDAMPGVPDDGDEAPLSPEQEAEFASVFAMMEADAGYRAAVLALWARSGLFVMPLDPGRTEADRFLSLPAGEQLAEFHAVHRTAAQFESVAGCRLDEAADRIRDQRDAGRLRGEEGRERKAAKYEKRVAWIVAKYRAERRRFGAGEAGDIAARERVAKAFERHQGVAVTDRTIRNALRKAGIVSTRAGKTWQRKDVELNDFR